MYQALYRKWRPRRFAEVVGQAHITDTLRSQVAADRLSHAYLFTGTRGTGKTSCAKILARAVNCEAPVEGDPCNHCPACRGIEDGSILDVLELDAASNNGVDQVRALRDEAVYTPAAVKRRVYIIDEVHMLTPQAFNALLKILEEPPAHLVFILATTELHKVPATIKSRCQQFAFRRIRAEEIVTQLKQIAAAEGLALEESAALLLSRLADGGLRDALSLLDQCMGGASRLDEARVLEVLGLAGNREMASLLAQIAREDAAAALETVGRLYREGKDMSALLGELTVLFRDLMIWKLAGSAGALLSGGFTAKQLEELAADFTSEELAAQLSVLQRTAAELVYSSNRRSDVELCVLRLCRRSLATDLEGLLARVSRLEEKLVQGGSLVTKAAPPAPENAPPAQSTQAADAPPWEVRPPDADIDAPPWEITPPSEAADVPPRKETPPSVAANVPPLNTRPKEMPSKAPVGGNGDWNALLPRLRDKFPPSVYSLLSKPELARGVLAEESLTIYLESEMSKKRLDRPELLQKIEAEVRALLSRPVTVKLLVEAAPEAAPEQPDRMQELLEKGRQNSGIISII